MGGLHHLQFLLHSFELFRRQGVPVEDFLVLFLDGGRHYQANIVEHFFGSVSDPSAKHAHVTHPTVFNLPLSLGVALGVRHAALHREERPDFFPTSNLHFFVLLHELLDVFLGALPDVLPDSPDICLVPPLLFGCDLLDMFVHLVCKHPISPLLLVFLFQLDCLLSHPLFDHLGILESCFLL